MRKGEMMFRISVFILLFLALESLVSAANREPQSCCDRCPDIVYNDLRVTWKKNKSCPGAFDKMPRTECEAKKMGFKKLKCECSETTLGIGYVKGKDKGLVVLYDVQGTVCGIQIQFRKEDLEKIKEYYPVDENEIYQRTEYDGKKYYTISVYFVNPETICTEGRSEEELEKCGTVQQLYIQSGKDPECDVLAIPFNGEGFNGTTWGNGQCIPGLGSHYVKDYKHFDCAHAFLFAPTYDEKGCLLGFAFGSMGCLHSSRRFEHLKFDYLKVGFPQPNPCCLYPIVKNTGGFTSVHVYFIDKPWKISCCS